MLFKFHLCELDNKGDIAFQENMGKKSGLFYAFCKKKNYNSFVYMNRKTLLSPLKLYIALTN